MSQTQNLYSDNNFKTELQKVLNASIIPDETSTVSCPPEKTEINLSSGAPQKIEDFFKIPDSK